jgi:hypothetical protein
MAKLIRGSLRLLPERYTVITATVDGRAGEVGTVYQACGFDSLRAAASPLFRLPRRPPRPETPPRSNR